MSVGVSPSRRAVCYLSVQCDIRKCNEAEVLRCKRTTMHSADTGSWLQPETMNGRLTYSTERHMHFTSFWPWHSPHHFYSYKPSNCINWNCNWKIGCLERRQFREKTSICCKTLCSFPTPSLYVANRMEGVAIKLNLATMNIQSQASGKNAVVRWLFCCCCCF